MKVTVKFETLGMKGSVRKATPDRHNMLIMEILQENKDLKNKLDIGENILLTPLL